MPEVYDDISLDMDATVVLTYMFMGQRQCIIVLVLGEGSVTSRHALWYFPLSSLAILVLEYPLNLDCLSHMLEDALSHTVMRCHEEHLFNALGFHLTRSCLGANR